MELTDPFGFWYIYLDRNEIYRNLLYRLLRLLCKYFYENRIGIRESINLAPASIVYLLVICIIIYDIKSDLFIISYIFDSSLDDNSLDPNRDNSLLS